MNSPANLVNQVANMDHTDDEPAMKKRKEEPGKSMPEIADLSLTWLAKASLISIYKTKPTDNLPAKAREVLEKIKAEVEEKNCFSYPVELDAKMPDTDGYRGLFDPIHSMVTNVCDPFQTNHLETYNPFSISFTGAAFDDPATVTSKELIDAAKKNEKRYDDTVSRKYLFEEDNELTDREIEMFRQDGHSPKHGYLPVPEFELKPGTPNAMDLLREKIMTTSMCVVTGLAEYTGFDESLFSLDRLAADAKGSKYPIEVIRQIAQSTSTNFPMNAEPNELSLPGGWETIQYRHNMLLSSFAKNYKTLVRLTEEAYEEIVKSPKKVEEVMRRLKDSLRDNAKKAPDTVKKDPAATLINFGSNIDLESAYYKRQLAALESGFPSFLRCTGNILAYSKESIRGLNKPQAYGKTPGCRTGPHVENSALISINHNIGPGDCTWYGVALEHAGKFQRLLETKLVGKAKDTLHCVDFWPQEEEIIAAGIPLMKFTQKPGSSVIVGVCAYHWVQSNDFTINLAWNNGQPTYMQLAMAAITHDNFLANKRSPVTPLETIAWNIAMESVECQKKGTQGLEMDSMTRALIKRILARSLSKAQLEANYINEEKLKSAKRVKKGLLSVERCFHCFVALFNHVPLFLVPKGKKLQGRQPVCFACLKKTIHDYEKAKIEYEKKEQRLKEKRNERLLAKKNGARRPKKARKGKKPVDPRSTHVVYQRYPIEKLCTIFDEFKI